MTRGCQIIVSERDRQIDVEGYTPRHDAEHHIEGDLADAAASYAVTARIGDAAIIPPKIWPWSKTWWKPSSPIRMLAKAGALIAGEIDRRLARGEKE